MAPTRVSRYSTSPRPPWRTYSHYLPTCRLLLPLSLALIIQGRITALRSSFDDASAITESRAEKHIRVRKQTLFQRDNDELCPAEPCSEERADVLRVREVQCCVDLVQDVHWRGLELKQRHDQRQRYERPLYMHGGLGYERGMDEKDGEVGVPLATAEFC